MQKVYKIDPIRSNLAGKANNKIPTGAQKTDLTKSFNCQLKQHKKCLKSPAKIWCSCMCHISQI